MMLQKLNSMFIYVKMTGPACFMSQIILNFASVHQKTCLL